MQEVLVDQVVVEEVLQLLVKQDHLVEITVEQVIHLPLVHLKEIMVVMDNINQAFLVNKEEEVVLVKQALTEIYHLLLLQEMVEMDLQQHQFLVPHLNLFMDQQMEFMLAVEEVWAIIQEKVAQVEVVQVVQVVEQQVQLTQVVAAQMEHQVVKESC